MEYEMHRARCELDDQGDLVLTVEGTDIRQVFTWDMASVRYPHFPGNGMRYRLVELGWMPDRLDGTALAGWSEAGEGVWTILCYRDPEDDTVDLPTRGGAAW